MLINYVSGVFVATTRDREEGAKLKALGGWRWHSGACDARWCKSNCPAKGVTGWWTTNAQTAARVTGDGVHAADSLAAIGAAKQAARVAPSRSPRIEFAKGVFFIVDADRGESEAIRAASGGDQRWRWHSQECSAKFCKKPCPIVGIVTDSWWTSDATLVRPLQAYLGDTARIELENRDNSLALSRAVSEGYSGDLPCPAGKSYLPFQAAGIRYAMSRPSSLIGDEMGLGKAQPVSEPVLTPGGWTTMGELQVGDLVVGRDGKATTVTGVFPQGKKKAFRVTLDDGASTRCCEEHLWLVQNRNDRFRGGKGRVMTLRQIMDGGLRDGSGSKWFVPLLSNPVRFIKPVELPINPYVLGQLLANGSMLDATPRWSGGKDQADLLGHHLAGTDCHMSPVKGSEFDYYLTFGGGRNTLSSQLRELGVHGKKSPEKFVPRAYMVASTEDRLALLRGLMDGDGTVSASGETVEYNSTSLALAEAVIELVRSLGGVAWMSTREPKFTYLGEKKTGKTDHRVRVGMPNGMSPFALPRKNERFAQRVGKYPPCHSIASVVEEAEEDHVCISVDADDHLYVTRDYIVTHNTVQAVGTVNADSAARTVLVICPAFLREVWNRHAVEWSVRQTRVVVLETPADVARAKKKDLLSRKGDETLWVVISYGGCRAESAVGKLVHAAVALASIDVLILDESHRTKEREAQQSQGAIALAKKAKRILALSGTPIPNRPIEMATTLSMLNPNFAFWRFAHRYCGAKQHRFGWDLSGATHLDELQRELRETVMIRRLKADVLKELPKKTWSVVVLDSTAIPTDLVASRVSSDKSDRAKATRMIAEAVGDKAAIRAAVDAELTALGIAFDGMSKERSALGGYKVEPALDYLSKLPQSECVIVFTHHKAVASAIYARLGGEKCGVYLDGSVDAEERVNRVDQFQGSSDPTFRYVVATIESAKEGLTITRASRVVFVEQSFTPGTMSQAEDRAHRIGQTRGVQVDYLVFDGTMDAYLCQMLAAKQSVATAALDSESDYVETAQNEVVLREEQPLPTEEFDAHDPSRYMRGVGGNAGGTRETDEQYARRTAERRGVTTAYQPTESEIAAVLAGMRALTEDDADRATEENGIGFAKSDVYVGHALAQLGTLTPELWALGARLCRKYRGQLGGGIVDATGVERA